MNVVCGRKINLILSIVMYRHFLKRWVDVLLSLIVLLVTSPFLIFVAILIKINSRGPVFFSQRRVGLNGRFFLIYKFRTMTDVPRLTTDEIYKDNAEVTSVGRMLRRLKIDELPQVLNVFVGDMSIVGPRPALESLYMANPEARERLRVRPGMTGLAQVNGNIYLPWEERLAFDSEYVRNCSFALDCKIVARTIGVVFLGEEKFLKE